MLDESLIEAEILRLTGVRGEHKSICPSDVARALSPDWQALLGPVRRTAARLAKAGKIDILRKGKPVDPDWVRGVVRLRIHRSSAIEFRPAPEQPACDE